ncbi:unnamed protein product, partial [Vitis vinifera]
MVARLTPDQKVACSIHVGFKSLNRSIFFVFRFKKNPNMESIVSLSKAKALIFQYHFCVFSLESMAFLSRLRPISSHRCRFFSSILSPDSATPLSSKEKSRAALSLLKSEQDPQRILEICRAAALTPESHLDRAGMLNDAVRTFEQMHQLGVDRTVRSLNALLFSCILAKNYKEANRIFLEFPKTYGIELNLDSYNTVLKAFSESGSSSSGYSILAEMGRKGVKPNATSFGILLAGFYNEEKYEDVGKVLKMMEEYKMQPGISTYNIRIQSLCKLKKSSEAKALLDGILARRMKPNSETYCHLIHGFCKEGNLDEAKKLFKDMVNRGCKPDSDCYFTLVYFLCQGGDFESALRFCKECMEKGWFPNISTMTSLVNGLVSISKVEEARELIGQIKEKFSRNVDKWNEIEAGLPQ